jgi:hypothetical protein
VIVLSPAGMAEVVRVATPAAMTALPSEVVPLKN